MGRLQNGGYLHSGSQNRPVRFRSQIGHGKSFPTLEAGWAEVYGTYWVGRGRSAPSLKLPVVSSGS